MPDRHFQRKPARQPRDANRKVRPKGLARKYRTRERKRAYRRETPAGTRGVSGKCPRCRIGTAYALLTRGRVRGKHGGARVPRSYRRPNAS